MRTIVRTIIAAGLLAGAVLLLAQRVRPWLQRAEHAFRSGRSRRAISGDGLAVDHDRQPGVPPETNDDYEDPLDQCVADSFPASDPAAVY